MKPQHLVIIGGVASGPTAAVEARRTNPDLNITLIEKGPDVSYSACEMPLMLAGKVQHKDELVRYAPHELATAFNIAVETHTSAEEIDLEHRKLLVRNTKTGKSRLISYDRLILATGARPIVPEALAISTQDVFVLRTLQDVLHIENRIKAQDVRHAVVIGSGYVGLDAAFALKQRGIRVTVLAPSGVLAKGLGETMQAVALQRITSEGLSVRKERATGLEKARDGKIIAVLTDKGEKVGCDLVLIAVGTSPATELAHKAGLKIGVSGGVVVDEQMRTSELGIWACGDCTEQTELIFGVSIAAPLSLNAFRSGRVAGRNAARNAPRNESDPMPRIKAAPPSGRPATLPPIVFAAAIGLGDIEIAHTGWTQEMAFKLGKDTVSATITHKTASAFTDHSTICITLVAERKTQRLVGAQIVGGNRSADRINVITALLRKGGTVGDLYDLDYVYSPPLAPSKDPLMVAARSLQKQF